MPKTLADGAKSWQAAPWFILARFSVSIKGVRNLNLEGLILGKKSIYRITILNWERHNSKHKASYKKTMIDNNFCWDSKIEVLPMSVKWMYLGLLLICGDMAKDTIEVSERMLKGLVENGIRFDKGLDSLQTLQLLKWEKITPLMNRIEENRIEEKINELPKGVKKLKKLSPLPLEEPPTGKILMAHYCDLWKSRYGSNPSFQKHHPKQLKDVGETNGVEKTKALLEAYFRAPDSWFVKKGHDIPTFVTNLSSIARFMETGRVVTQNEIRQMDNSVSTMNTLDALMEGKI